MRPLELFLVLILGALSANIGWSQVAIQGPQSAYEGQNVSGIDLIANPRRDTDSLRVLVAQKAGKPYSQSDIESSVAALQSTGKFQKVEVNVVPEITGLRLDFLLEPAYYIGIVRFPGLGKSFSYTRLLQVTNLSDEDPFAKERLPGAVDGLQKFLRQNGYFLAEVKPSIEIDDAHQLVNVDFQAALGRHARIGQVTFQSSDPRQDARLEHSVRSWRARLTGALLKSGKPYTPERIMAAKSSMRHAFARQNYIASKVSELPPQYHADTNRVDLAFKVETGPAIVVQVNGARLSRIPFMSNKERKKLIPIYSEGTIDRDLVREGQQNLVDHFQQAGYFNAEVTVGFQQSPEKDILTYQINKGHKFKVDQISFHGNHGITEHELMPQLVVKRSHPWARGAVSEKLLAQSARNLEAFYVDHGYLKVKVTSGTLNHGDKIDVVFTITEGDQSLVSNVRVTGNHTFSQNALVAPTGFQLRPGKPFSPRRLAEDRNRITANYLDHGYLNVEVAARVLPDPDDKHRIAIVYEVNEHQPVHVGEVIYLGQQHTRLSLIRKTTNIPTESPMRRGELLGAESRLYELSVFDWASVGPKKPITDQTEEDALVKVHEANRTDIIYGFGFEISHRGGNIPSGTVAVPGLPPVQTGKFQIAPSQATFASPQGSIEFNRRNMRGLAETASLSLLLSRLDQRFVSGYTQPRFVGSQWSSLTSFSLERNTENPLFAASLGDASFQLERLLNRKTNTRLQLRYDFNKTYLSHLLVSQLVLPQDRNVRLSTLSATLIRDTRDKPLDAHHGNFGTLNLAITPTALGSSASFAKLFGQYALYKPFHSIIFADSIRLGLASPFSNSFVPTSQLFFSGGGTSLRGFPIDEAGPQRLVPFCNVFSGQTGCVNINVPVGGRQLFIFNSEARFPLGVMKALGGVVFYDGGNVYSAINLNNFVNNYSNTVGVGLRYSTPIGPIRFDIGRNLNPVQGIGSVQYYITLGQAF